MRSSVFTGLSVLALAASASAVTLNTPRRPDLNAFVNRKVTTTGSLVNQVRSDPEVSDRYQRHFGMNRSELVAYLSGLHPAPLAKAGTYSVYSVPVGGRVKMHWERLPKGSPMFLDRSGKPTLIVKCGNPVVLGPSRVRKANLTSIAPEDNDSTRELAQLTPRDTEITDSEELVALTPVVPESEILPPTATAPPTADLPPVETTAIAPHAAVFPWIAGLPLLIPLIGGLSNGGGGGNVTPVPEPAPMIALSVGAVAVLRRRRKA